MPFIPSPIVLLGSLIASLLLFLSGFFYGKYVEKAEQALDVVTVQDETIDDANRDVEAEQQRAVAAAKREAEKRASFQILKLKGERDAALKAKPDCSRNPTSMGLLLDTIRSANGEEAAANKLPEPVPATTRTD